MDKIYLVFGIVMCGLFVYASQIGWTLFGDDSASHAVKGGPSIYHK